MGFNTAMMFCNDDIADYERDPERFVRIAVSAASSLRDERVWGITVHQSDHADATQLIAVGHNSSTKVHTTYYVPSHHTEEGQLAILRSWASTLGYDLHRKSDKLHSTRA